MANSNSLVLLPPRSTEQPSQDSSKTKPAKKVVRNDTFGRKLENAKTAKLQLAVKKPAVESTPKKTTAPLPACKAVDESQEDQQPAAKAAKDPKKPTDAADELQTDPQDEIEQPALPTAKAVAVTQELMHAAIDKKPVKPAKAAAVKAAVATAEPAQVVAKPHQEIKVTSPAAAKPSDVKAKVTAVDSEKDQTEPAEAAPADAIAAKPTASDDASNTAIATGTGEFGTGKLVAGEGEAAKNAAADSGPTQPDSSADPTAVAAAALADALPADAAVSAEPMPSRSAARSEIQPGDVASSLSAVSNSTTTPPAAAGKSAAAAASTSAQFVEENHPKIVTAIQGQLLPHGGTVQLRLDPPDLGALQVTMHLKDGVMTASFETSNDEATKLLSHSLGQLKSSLEAAGVSVEKIHVEQAPRRDSQGNSDGDSRQGPPDQQRQQEQQRREMVQRMWRKLAGGGDPLDLVA